MLCSRRTCGRRSPATGIACGWTGRTGCGMSSRPRRDAGRRCDDRVNGVVAAVLCGALGCGDRYRLCGMGGGCLGGASGAGSAAPAGVVAATAQAQVVRSDVDYSIKDVTVLAFLDTLRDAVAHLDDVQPEAL